MAASVQLLEKNGAGGTGTPKNGDTIRFKNADNYLVDLANPMVKPPTGSDFSYEKWIRFNVTGGTYTQITNIKAYSDGGNGLGTGVLLWAKAVTAYSTPAEATATAGYTNFFTYTSGAALTIGSGTYTSTGEKGDHLVMMCEVQSTSSGGLTPTENLSVSWDEI
jgi:hypothetical protein